MAELHALPNTARDYSQNQSWHLDLFPAKSGVFKHQLWMKLGVQNFNRAPSFIPSAYTWL